MPKIRVLKPFVFTHPAKESERLTTETRFIPGIIEVSDDVYDHPWIQAGADGKIESAAQAAVRLEAERVQREAADKERAENTAAAEGAVGRLAIAEAASRGATGTAAEIERELNTPVSVLKKRGPGAGVTTKPA
jgi:hypothetical protein